MVNLWKEYWLAFYVCVLDLKGKEYTSEDFSKKIENVSLTNTQYEEYLNLSNEIGEMFPDLISRTDTFGNSIINVGDDVDTLTEKLEKMQILEKREDKMRFSEASYALLIAGALIAIAAVTLAKKNTNRQTRIRPAISKYFFK